MSVHLSCPSCGAPLNRSVKACNRCGTPIVHTDSEQVGRAASAVGDAVKSTVPTTAAVAMHLSGLLFQVPFLTWLLLVPLVCAFFKQGSLLREHARVWWRWLFDWLATTVVAVVPFAIGGLICQAMEIEIGYLVLVGVAFVVFVVFEIVYLVSCIKAAMAASNGVVYVYPKLLLSKMGVL